MNSIAKENKVAIIGTGMVGASLAYAMCIKGTARNLVLIDQDKKRAEGEAMDLNHSLSMLRPMSIRSGGYELCQGADVVVITAGTAQRPGETRLALLGRNSAIIKQILAAVLEYNPSPLILVVSNPVDVLTYVAIKESGLGPGRVFGSGTVLDSSRFRFLLSQHCAVDPRNIHAYVVGEHGDSEVALWSQVHVAGMPLMEYCPSCDRGCTLDERTRIFDEVRNAAYAVIERKGATYYAIGVALVEILEAILQDQRRILTVSTLVEDYSGMNDLCLSLPCVVARGGVEKVIKTRLPEEELAALRRSASILRDNIDAVESGKS